MLVQPGAKAGSQSFSRGWFCSFEDLFRESPHIVRILAVAVWSVRWVLLFVCFVEGTVFKK